VAQRQHDGSDHGDQQDQARSLEEVDVVRVEQPPDRLGIGDARSRRRGRRGASRGTHGATDDAIADDRDQLDQQHQTDERADGCVLDEARAQLGEIDVEHHNDEQEQHRDGADVDDDQDHRQELGAEQHEEARGIEERKDQPQHRVDGIARDDDQQSGHHRDAREQVEEQGRQCHPSILTADYL
jgi:hypothetical protein